MRRFVTASVIAIVMTGSAFANELCNTSRRLLGDQEVLMMYSSKCKMQLMANNGKLWTKDCQKTMKLMEKSIPELTAFTKEAGWSTDRCVMQNTTAISVRMNIIQTNWAAIGSLVR